MLDPDSFCGSVLTLRRTGHRLKSDKTKTSQALQSLSCMRRVILSGTPIQNNLGEFFAMMGESFLNLSRAESPLKALAPVRFRESGHPA